MLFDPSSKDRLTDHDLRRFPDDTLFHRLARAICHAGCLPRKELFEAWETARRVRRVCRGGRASILGVVTVFSLTRCCCWMIRPLRQSSPREAAGRRSLALVPGGA